MKFKCVRGAAGRGGGAAAAPQVWTGAAERRGRVETRRGGSLRSKDVSSSRRKARKAVFSAGSEQRRVLMSARLDKELVEQHGIRSIPVRKGDEVKIVRGKQATRDGKVVGVFRRRFVIYVDRVTRTKANQQEAPIPIAPSNVVITKLEMNPSRERIIARKREGRAAAKAKTGAAESK
jgi:large subunit ribosomal protein L26e